MKVYVKTPARLHLGLIDMNRELSRVFGGLGVGINYPNVVLEVSQNEKLGIVGERKEVTKKYVRRFLEKYEIRSNFCLKVKRVIPEHSGLGSGTQLALAVAIALAKLYNINASIQELSLAMGRGKRTGVGTAIFDQGGFVVDGGKAIDNEKRNIDKLSPLIFSRAVPESWRFVVVIPDIKKGLADSKESIAFQEVPIMRSEDVGIICRLIMMKLLPSLIENNIKSFGEAVTQIQVTVGKNFSSVQGGTFSSPIVEEGIEYLIKLGAYGAGQSSWGPAFYGISNDNESQKLKEKMIEFLEEKTGGIVFIAEPNNKGAYIKVIH
jgi:beta-RFAP synthase